MPTHYYIQNYHSSFFSLLYSRNNCKVSSSVSSPSSQFSCHQILIFYSRLTPKSSCPKASSTIITPRPSRCPHNLVGCGEGWVGVYVWVCVSGYVLLVILPNICCNCYPFYLPSSLKRKPCWGQGLTYTFLKYPVSSTVPDMDNIYLYFYGTWRLWLHFLKRSNSLQ